METIFIVHGVLAGLALAWMLVVALRHRRRDRHAAELIRLHGQAEGPPTLHPVIDPDICIGSGACVRACPEDRALVLMKGRGHLAQASGCVGHGECLRACPVHAITLVFGTSRRGVDLPDVDARFESSQPGLYIAGELGGMGLVATAVRQGTKAIEAIAESLRGEPGTSDVLPLLVVGAGPAGIAAVLAAHERGLRTRWIEKEPDVGGAVRSYPRGKVVMTTPVDLPVYGRVHLRRTTKAALIELWTDVLSRGSIAPEFGTALEAVAHEGDVLVARTTAGPIRARRILLATGRRGRPRWLGVDGEELAHVHHHLDDPVDHGGRRVLVVGGGDVAVEAALALAERPRTTVTLCHRGERFDRVKPALHEKLVTAEATGLRVLRGTTVSRFAPGSARLATADDTHTIEIDSAFVLVGSDLPTDMLAASGVRVQTHYGDAPVSR